MGVASVQPAGRGPGRKDLLLHGLLPHSRGGPVPAAALLTAACYSRAQPEAKRRPRRAGSRAAWRGCHRPPSVRRAAGGRRAACPHGARPRAHVLRALPSPPPDRWLKASQFWKPVLRGNLDAQEWKVLIIAYLSPESPAKRKTWFTTGVRNTRHASQFKRGKVFASPEMGLFPSCLN